MITRSRITKAETPSNNIPPPPPDLPPLPPIDEEGYEDLPPLPPDYYYEGYEDLPPPPPFPIDLPPSPDIPPPPRSEYKDNCNYEDNLARCGDQCVWWRHDCHCGGTVLDDIIDKYCWVNLA